MTMHAKELLRKCVPVRWWELLRQIRIKRTAQRFPKRSVTHTYGHFPLNVCIADPLGEAWYDHDWAVLPELELLSESRMTRGARVFDLGAHQAVVAMQMARYVGESGQVIAVEGMRHNCEVASRNKESNNFTNMVIERAVIADKVGEMKFFEGFNGSIARNAVGHTVQAVTVDSLAQRYGVPDVVFIDIEGYELHALRGAAATLKRACDWFIEVHVGAGLEHYGGSASEVLDFFPAERFTRYAWRLDADEEPKLLRDNPSVVENRFALVALHK